MSSPGINPLAVYDPQTYAAQLAIQRRQALAQSLLQSGEEPPGGARYGGLRNAGNAILGAFLAKRADQQLGDLYNPQNQQQPGMQGPSPQLSNMPGSNPVPQPQTNANLDPEGNPAGSNASPQGQPGFFPSQPSQPQPQGAGQMPDDASSLPPQAQRIYAQIPHIPGMPARQALNFFLTNPAGYQAQWAKQFEATDLQKNVSAAYGQGDSRGQSMLQGTLAKGAAVNMRPGGGVLNYGDNSVITMPNQSGIQTTFPYGASGPAVNGMVPGGALALTQAAAAQGYGRAATTPAIGYDANNMPMATNQAAMLGPNAPQAQPTQQPSALFGQPIGESIVKGLFPGAAITSGQRNPGYNAQVGGVPNSQHIPGNAVDFVLPPGKTFADVQRAFQASGLPASELINEGSHIHWGWGDKPQSQASAMLPELPAGQASYMQGQAKDAADRHDATVAAASESPMRINVLDNIIGLSRQGVATGPGQEWQNAVLGYAANTPGLSHLMGAAKDNVGRFQELQKFTYQNAIRSWQAAGGTGTDAQMQSMAHANPNDHLFPQALQTIAQWGKAAELAVQGKANAQDRFLAQNGQTPNAQIKFENTWRNNFDPKVFQYSLMSPAEKQVFAQHELKTPQAAQAFLAKQQQLRGMGALQ